LPDLIRQPGKEISRQKICVKAEDDMKDFNHKHEPPQLKERSSTVNDMLASFYTFRPWADRLHSLLSAHFAAELTKQTATMIKIHSLR